MGLSNFHSPVEGVLPLLVMNTVISVAMVKNKLRSVLQVVGSRRYDDDDDYDDDHDDPVPLDDDGSRVRRVSITRYGSLCRNNVMCTCGNNSSSNWPMECSVCLCRFEADDKVSELSCKHFFHKGCLDKWFDNQHVTCPLCRSVM